jgi:hypothetical protein
MTREAAIFRMLMVISWLMFLVAASKELHAAGIGALHHK